MKARKFDYLFVVQGNFGQGWEDCAASLSRRESMRDLRAYRINDPGFAYRIIARREIRRDYSSLAACI